MGNQPRFTQMLALKPLLTSVVAIAAFSGLAAGCGGGGSSGVANVASSTVPSAPGSSATSTAGSPAGSSARVTGLLGYASCMRSHGVLNFPDPTGSGGIPKEGVIRAYSEVSNAQAQAATNACRHLLAAGGSLSGRPSPTITPADQADYLKAAACMRSHGFPGFPDPVFHNNNVTTNIPSSVDQDSPTFKNAAAICTKLIPAGLPYSSSNAR